MEVFPPENQVAWIGFKVENADLEAMKDPNKLDDLHMTFRYIGQVTPEQAEKLGTLTECLAKSFPNSIAFFPEAFSIWNEQHTVLIGEVPESLYDYREFVTNIIKDILEIPVDETWPFNPHVSLRHDGKLPKIPNSKPEFIRLNTLFIQYGIQRREFKVGG